MARILTTAMQTAISAKEGYADVWLIEITTSATVLRWATNASNVSWTYLWTGVGGIIEFAAPSETSDPSGQSMRMSLSGVDQTIIAQVLTANVRGRRCRLYWGQINLSTGLIISDPVEAFSGLMNSVWEISEVPSDTSSRGTVTVSTTIVSEMARYLFRRLLRTNTNSLRLMQARGDITPGSADTFFQTLPDIVGKPVYWGRVSASAGPAVGYIGPFYGSED